MSNEPQKPAHSPVLIIIVCYSLVSLLVIGISEVKNAKNHRGRLLIPSLCSWLALTAMLAHIQGQTSPEAHIPPILTIIVCYILLSLLVFGIFGVENFKFWNGRPLRLLLCNQLALTAMSSHFQGQMSPEANSSPSLLVINISEVENAEIRHGHPLRHCL